VIPRGLGDAEMAQGMPPAVDDKYTRFETSGLEFEVKPGANDLPIKVTRPKSARR
jgi:hypothetical protein